MNLKRSLLYDNEDENTRRVDECRIHRPAVTKSRSTTMTYVLRYLTVSLVAVVLINNTCALASEPLQPVRFQHIKLDGFWRDQVKRLTEKWIPHCIKQMEASGQGQELLNLIHAAKALKGETHGRYTGLKFSDAYVYNIVESICLALAVDPEGDETLARAQQQLSDTVEDWIPIMLAAQMDDGYIHSFHTINQRPRYTNIEDHEFYVQGYFIEMGVAHYRSTAGTDRRLYDAARKCANHLCDTFGPEPKRNWIYGHAGMGMALCRLARLVNETEGPGQGDKYFELAKFLLDHRHTVEKYQRAYHQSHRPVVEMQKAVGHAVRATYFYTAMADLAMLTRDPAYRTAVDRIWDSAVNRKLYLTGGVGASHEGEAFDGDYALRNNGYCESCAGCGLSFWSDRMHRIHKDGHYIDVQERVLYNNILGAIELSGENFYYQNPLVDDRARHAWHVCPCCVGNIPRALMAVKDLMYSLNTQRNTLYVNHFVASEAVIDDVAGTSLRIEQATDYPWQGDVGIFLFPEKPKPFTVKVRVPDRGESELYTPTPDRKGKVRIKVNGQEQGVKATDGYVTLTRTWKRGDRIELDLPMDVLRIYCDNRVAANRGRVALQRGPLVYSVEQIDHERDIHDLVLPREATLSTAWKPNLLKGIMAIACNEPVLFAIPNFVRLNRGGLSQVWIVEDPQAAIDGYIRSWQVSGPYSRPGVEGRALLDLAFGPETGHSGDWNTLALRGGNCEVDLAAHIGGEHRVAYLRTRIYSPTARRAKLELGSDDGVKVWLNRSLVHQNNEEREVSPADDKVDMALQQGWNHLLVKVTQGVGGWGFIACVTDEDRKVFKDLKISSCE